MFELLSAGWACPMCKELVAGVMSRLSQGYYWSILLMVSMPFVVVGFVTWRVVRAARRGPQ